MLATPQLQRRHGLRTAPANADTTVVAERRDADADAILTPLDAEHSPEVTVDGPDEPLRTAYGIVIGLVVSGALWGVIALVALAIWS